MLRLLPKTFSIMAVCGASMVWAQADVPPAPASAGAAAEAATDAPAETAADGAADAVETPPTDANADLDANANADLPAAPVPAADINADAEIDANLKGDINARRNADARGDGNVRGRAGANSDSRSNGDLRRGSGTQTDVNARDRSRRQNGQTQGRAGARSQAQVDLSKRPALGVSFRNQGDALVISRVYPNSPAARMGLRSGDRIVRFNGQDYAETQMFVDAAGQVSLDDDAEIVYVRDGQNYTGNVRFMPWSQVFIDDDGDIETQRRVLRPGIGDANDGDDGIEDAVEDGRAVPTPLAPQVIPNEAINGKVEIDDDGVEIGND